MHRLNSFACRSSSFAISRMSFASQKCSAWDAHAASFIADHPERRFGRHELVCNHYLHIKQCEQVGQQLKSGLVHGEKVLAKEDRQSQSLILTGADDPRNNAA